MKRGIKQFALIILMGVAAVQAQTDSIRIKLELQRQERLQNSTQNFVDNRALYQKGQYFGYINPRGEEKIPAMFPAAKPFSEGLAAVLSSRGFWGFIDTTGKTIIPGKYQEVQDFREGSAMVVENDIASIINKKGVKIASLGEYQPDMKFSSGLINVKENGLWGYKNQKGRWIISPKYDLVAEPFQANWAIARRKDNYEFIDTLGRNILTFACGYIQQRNANWTENTPLILMRNGKYGCMKIDGTILIPFEYENIYKDAYNNYIVTQNQLFGAYTAEGIENIKTLYQSLTPISSNLYSAYQNGKNGILDAKGEVKIPPIYEDIVMIRKEEKDFLYNIQKEGKWGLMNEDFRLIIPPTYDAPYVAHANNDYFAVKLQDKIGLVDIKGKVQIPCKYDAISFACSDLVRLYIRKASPTTTKASLALNPNNYLCGWATLSGKILSVPQEPTISCSYPEQQIQGFKILSPCELMRQRGEHYPCDDDGIRPCYQCAMNCPEESWLKAHGYY